MNSARACTASVGVIFLIWITGCDDNATTRPPAVQVRPSTTGSEGPQTPTMTRIWDLRRERQPRAVIEECDRVVAEGAGPDVLGAALYVKADSLRQLGEYAPSEQLFGEVLAKYPNAGWDDPGVGGRIHAAPLCKVGRILASEKDSSPFPETSEAYTTLAWKYLNKGRFETARMLATTCIHSFEEVAQQQQDAYKRRYGSRTLQLSPNPRDNEPVLEQFWALFDVGTCHFIVGQAFQREADLLADDAEHAANKRTLYDAAIQEYNTVIEKYSGAWCFDPRGPWYWSVAKGANDNKNIITVMLRRNAP
jgi:tetratricopeptide (TPR) repeat protein